VILIITSGVLGQSGPISITMIHGSKSVPNKAKHSHATPNSRMRMESQARVYRSARPPAKHMVLHAASPQRYLSAKVGQPSHTGNKSPSSHTSRTNVIGLTGNRGTGSPNAYQSTPEKLTGDVQIKNALSQGLVAQWIANQGYTDIISGIPAVPFGGATIDASSDGKAYDFGNGNPGLGVDDVPQLRITGSFSICARVLVRGISSGIHNEIFFRGDDRGGLDPYSLSIESDGRLNFHVESLTNAFDLRSPDVIPTNGWLNLCATFDATTGIATLYLNGGKIASGQTEVRPFELLDPSSNPGCGIGNCNGNGRSWQMSFSGRIDYVGIYSRALGSTEVGWISQGGLANKLAVAGFTRPRIDADNFSTDSSWTIRDSRYVVLANSSIHFVARDPKLGIDCVSKPISLPEGQPWEVDFKVQMQPAPGTGMSVQLLRGKSRVCWMGAGDYYKYISGFVTGDASNMPFDAPWDSSWHSFRYISDGKRLSLWHNDQKMGDVALSDTPDTLYLESTGIDLTVTGISITTGPNLIDNRIVGYNGPAVPTPPDKVLFDESGDHTNGFLTRWKTTDNTGNIVLTPSVVSLRSSRYGCPEIQTLTNPFPADNWSVSFGFRYATTGNYGTNIGCTGKDGNLLFCVHQDVSGQFFKLGNKELERSAPNNDWHVLNVTKSGNQYTALWDGKEIGTNTSSTAPTSITIGGGSEANPWDWNDIDIRFVKVEGDRVFYDTTSLNAVHASVLPPAPLVRAHARAMTVASSKLLDVQLVTVRQELAKKDSRIASLRHQVRDALSEIKFLSITTGEKVALPSAQSVISQPKPVVARSKSPLTEREANKRNFAKKDAVIEALTSQLMDAQYDIDQLRLLLKKKTMYSSPTNVPTSAITAAALPPSTDPVPCSNVEIHATYSKQNGLGGNSLAFTGTITNIGSTALTSVVIWCKLQGFPTVAADAAPDAMADTVSSEPYLFVMCDTYRNLKPGETRQVSEVVPIAEEYTADMGVENIPPGRKIRENGYGIVVGATLIGSLQSP